MLARIMSYGLTGLNGYPVCVEVDMVNAQMPSFDIVGLPDLAVRESRERVRAALKNSGIFLPQAQRVTVNLAPADTKKEGPIYDLPIALGLMCAQERLEAHSLREVVVLGELSLNGELRPVRGALPMAIAALAKGYRKIVLPRESALECAYLAGMEIYPADDLISLIGHFSGDRPIKPLETRDFSPSPIEIASGEVDMAQIRGQLNARRALEIAAAGGHNMLMIGPPGSGKTMLARALPGILPPLSFEEALEITQIQSVAGASPEGGMARNRPFRAPHHTASTVAMIGGGRAAQPGEISKAHNGVLFLDELPEYPRPLLESLRQPLEDGVVTVSRIGAQFMYPSRFLLLCAMNPCPCGHYGSKVHACRCNANEIRRYMNRISGPLLDRIDIHVEVSALPMDDMLSDFAAESSEAVATRVMMARNRQIERYQGAAFSNSALNQKQVTEYCALDEKGKDMLAMASKHYGFSARAYTRLIKVARTIADLAGADGIGQEHMAEAVQYRALDSKYWGENA